MGVSRQELGPGPPRQQPGGGAVAWRRGERGAAGGTARVWGGRSAAAPAVLFLSALAALALAGGALASEPYATAGEGAPLKQRACRKPPLCKRGSTSGGPVCCGQFARCVRIGPIQGHDGFCLP